MAFFFLVHVNHTGNRHFAAQRPARARPCSTSLSTSGYSVVPFTFCPATVALSIALNGFEPSALLLRVLQTSEAANSGRRRSVSAVTLKSRTSFQA